MNEIIENTHNTISPSRREMVNQVERELDLEILKAIIIQVALDKIYLKKEDIWEAN